MRLAGWIGAFLLAATPAAAQTPQSQPASPPVHGFEVVRAYPHDGGAYTQGLAYVDGVLFESTGRSPSTLRRVGLEDGVVRQRLDLAPDLFSEGLTEIDGRLVTLTWKNGKGFVWNAADLSPVGEFALEGEGWGLTDDGARLIVSDGTSTLRFLDPETKAETGRVEVTLGSTPLEGLNELEWIDGEVWANVWMLDVLVRIDPVGGAVTGIVDLTTLFPDRPGLDPTNDVLNGIAWDAESRRLFVTGKHWPSLYEIRLTPPGD